MFSWSSSSMARKLRKFDKDERYQDAPIHFSKIPSVTRGMEDELTFCETCETPIIT